MPNEPCSICRKPILPGSAVHTLGPSHYDCYVEKHPPFDRKKFDADLKRLQTQTQEVLDRLRRLR